MVVDGLLRLLLFVLETGMRDLGQVLRRQETRRTGLRFPFSSPLGRKGRESIPPNHGQRKTTTEGNSRSRSVEDSL